MAEENDIEAQDNAEAGSAAEEASEGAGKGLVLTLIAVVVLAVAVAGGYGLGTVFRGPADAQAAPSMDESEAGSAGDQEGSLRDDYEYVEFTPITVNLKEERLARYIRASITLAIRKDGSKASKGARKLIEKKMPELKNWLNIFFSDCTLDDVYGKKKLNRLRREIRDSLNDQLWPSGQSVIDRVLFREFAVQ